MQLTLFDDATDCPTQLSYGKTSPESSQHETTPSDVFWQLCLANPNISESPNAAEECSLWQVVETDVSPKYYLSNRAKAGILKRAKHLKKNLPPLLKAALEHIENPM